jgi:hypothetical protein
MDMKRLALWLGLTILSPVLRADTLTLRSNIEINGRVEYENDSFTITAKYKNENKKFTFDRREVRSLEISTRDFNPGQPPLRVSTFEPRAGNTRDASREASANVQGAENTAANKRGSQSRKSIFDPEKDFAAGDVILLRDKTKVVGRIMLIQKGYISIQTANGGKQLEEQKAATVLVAPN